MFKKPIIAISLFFTLSMPVLAADDPLAGLGKPQQSQSVDNFVKPYMVVGNYKQDQNRVFMFFSYTCPYCQQVWWGMEEWGKTIPSLYRCVSIPTIITIESSRVAAMAYFIAKELRPNRLHEFNRLAYAVGENSRDISGKGYVNALFKIGLSEAEIRQALNSPQIDAQIKRAMNLAKRYNVRQTPSFAVAGKYTTDVGYANGDYKTLVKLLNALVSKDIEERSK